jgi:hypothetical protein
MIKYLIEIRRNTYLIKPYIKVYEFITCNLCFFN